GVVEGDVGRRCAHLLDQLAEQGVHQLRRDVGSVGAVAVIVDLVQVQLDDDLLASFVANGALAAAAVEVGEDLVPGGLVGGGVADRADAGGDHGGYAAGLDAEGRAQRRVCRLAGGEGRLGRGRGLGVGCGDFPGGDGGGAAEH